MVEEVLGDLAGPKWTVRIVAASAFVLSQVLVRQVAFDFSPDALQASLPLTFVGVGLFVVAWQVARMVVGLRVTVQDDHVEVVCQRGLGTRRRRLALTDLILVDAVGPALTLCCPHSDLAFRAPRQHRAALPDLARALAARLPPMSAERRALLVRGAILEDTPTRLHARFRSAHGASPRVLLALGVVPYIGIVLGAVVLTAIGETPPETVPWFVLGGLVPAAPLVAIAAWASRTPRWVELDWDGRALTVRTLAFRRSERVVRDVQAATAHRGELMLDTAAGQVAVAVPSVSRRRWEALRVVAERIQAPSE